MQKNMFKLAECPNDHLVLRIISARDPEVLQGYQRAWPHYFTSEPEPSRMPLTRIMKASLDYAREICLEAGVPTIKVLLPWHGRYKEEGVPATRGLLFQLGDFSEITQGSVVRLYHTKWVVVEYYGPPSGASVILAPLECIDLEK